MRLILASICFLRFRRARGHARSFKDDGQSLKEQFELLFSAVSDAELKANMPGVEVLPNSTSIKAPGWALVPDTGHGPSHAISQPTTKRGRAARVSNLGGGDTSARQENAVLKHLADLDKDSHRDVQIPVPKDTIGRGLLDQVCIMRISRIAESSCRREENHT